MPQPKVIPLGSSGKEVTPVLAGPPESVKMKSGLVILAPGKSVGKHSTEGNEELLVVFEGQGVMTFEGGSKLQMKANSAVYCPPRRSITSPTPGPTTCATCTLYQTRDKATRWALSVAAGVGWHFPWIPQLTEFAYGLCHDPRWDSKQFFHPGNEFPRPCKRANAIVGSARLNECQIVDHDRAILPGASHQERVQKVASGLNESAITPRKSSICRGAGLAT